MSEKIQLSKSDRQKVWWRSTFLQGSWNYERMQNLGWAYAMIPAIKKLYTKKEDQAAALERHMEFFNTHPYVAAPILGVTLALEEERANGAPLDDTAIQGVKIGMMGPLAGIGDPVFWFTVRPILGALGASLAMDGSLLGPVIFFLSWNIIRMAFLWYTQEFGYKAGNEITKDLSGGILQDITKGASILGMFVIGALVKLWVNIKFAFVVSSVPLEKKAYVHWNKLVEFDKKIEWDKLKPEDLKDVVESLRQSINEGIKEGFTHTGDGLSPTPEKVTTFQDNLDLLIPGLAGLLLTFLCMWLLKKKVSPITIIVALFAIGVAARYFGIM